MEPLKELMGYDPNRPIRTDEERERARRIAEYEADMADKRKAQE